VFTFNAGYASGTTAADTLEAHGMHGTFYVVSSQLRQGPYYTAYMAASDLVNLTARGHDIGSMTVTQVDLTTVDATRLESELANSQAVIQGITGHSVLHLAYPYGSVNANVATATASHYASGRTLTTSTSAFTPSVDPYHLPGLMVMQSTTLAQAKSFVDLAASQGVYVVLSFERIITSPGTYDWTPSNLDALAGYVQSRGVTVSTVAQLVAGVTPPPPPPYGLPAAPALSATSGNATVSLSWTTPANGGSAITGYALHRGTSSGSESLYRALGVTNAFKDVNVTNGASYYYKVAAVNANGAGPNSSEVAATPRQPPPPPPSTGAVVFTFDDGTPDHAAAAKALVDHGFRGTFFIITDCLNAQTSRSCLTPAQVQALSQAGHDVESHSVTHPDLTTLGASALTSQLVNSQSYLRGLTGTQARHFAYPYGAHNANVETQTAKYYKTGRIYLSNPSVASIPTLLAQSGTNPTLVPGLGVMKVTTLTTAEGYLDYARTHNVVLVLVFHEIVAKRGDAYSWTPTQFNALLDYAVSTNVAVKTMTQAYGA